MCRKRTMKTSVYCRKSYLKGATLILPVLGEVLDEAIFHGESKAFGSWSFGVAE
jgi:hypothetical protein